MSSVGESWLCFLHTFIVSHQVVLAISGWIVGVSEWVHFHNDFFTWWRRYYVILQQIEKKFTNANELQNFKSTTYIRWRRYGSTYYTLLMYEILLLWFTTSQSITILELRRSFLMLQVPSSKITRTRPINQ